MLLKSGRFIGRSGCTRTIGGPHPARAPCGWRGRCAACPDRPSHTAWSAPVTGSPDFLSRGTGPHRPATDGAARGPRNPTGDGFGIARYLVNDVDLWRDTREFEGGCWGLSGVPDADQETFPVPKRRARRWGVLDESQEPSEPLLATESVPRLPGP